MGYRAFLHILNFYERKNTIKSSYTSHHLNTVPLLINARELANKRPNTFMTDGAPKFHKSFTKEFLQYEIQELGISHIFVCKVTTIITKWRE